MSATTTGNAVRQYVRMKAGFQTVRVHAARRHLSHGINFLVTAVPCTGSIMPQRYWPVNYKQNKSTYKVDY